MCAILERIAPWHVPGFSLRFCFVWAAKRVVVTCACEDGKKLTNVLSVPVATLTVQIRTFFSRGQRCFIAGRDPVLYHNFIAKAKGWSAYAAGAAVGGQRREPLDGVRCWCGQGALLVRAKETHCPAHMHMHMKMYSRSVNYRARMSPPPPPKPAPYGP